MFTLVTKYDVEKFVLESSPHVKNVRVNETDNGDINIVIELTWLYHLFFSRSYYRFIINRIEPYLLMGVDYYVTVT